MAESAGQVTLHLEALLFLLTGLSFVINVPKSVTTPTQQMEFLGLQVHSTTLHFRLPKSPSYQVGSVPDPAQR